MTAVNNRDEAAWPISAIRLAPFTFSHKTLEVGKYETRQTKSATSKEMQHWIERFCGRDR